MKAFKSLFPFLKMNMKLPQSGGKVEKFIDTSQTEL